MTNILNIFIYSNSFTPLNVKNIIYLIRFSKIIDTNIMFILYRFVLLYMFIQFYPTHDSCTEIQTEEGRDISILILIFQYYYVYAHLDIYIYTYITDN